MKNTVKLSVFLAVVFFSFHAPAWATYTLLRDAGTLSRGKLNNDRLNFGDANGPVQTGPGVITSTMVTGIASNTAFYNYTSTSDAQQATFRNYSTTADVKNDNFNAFQATSDAQQNRFVNFRATGDAQTANLAAATFSVTTPFGIAPVVAPSTAVVFGTTNPYRTFSIPAAAWTGLGESSASWTNGGVPISSGPTATVQYNRIGRTFMEFKTSTYSFAYVEFRMPFEWDGSSVGFQVEWFASSGTTNKNVLWSIGAVAIASGTSSIPTFTSSTTVVSTYKAANQEALSPLSSGFSVEGSPVPGIKVVFMITVSGGDGGNTFDGIPRATDLLVSYRQAVWDGKPR